MGWVSTDNEHEGWAACVAPDGRLSASSSAEGMLFEGTSGRYKRDKIMPDYEVVPDAEIVGWRGQCMCGWHGDMWERVTSPADGDFNHRRDYVSPDDSAHASLEVEDAIHDEWKAHIGPSEALVGVETVVREYAQAGHRLDKTVAAAKAAGASSYSTAGPVSYSDQMRPVCPEQLAL